MIELLWVRPLVRAVIDDADRVITHQSPPPPLRGVFFHRCLPLVPRDPLHVGDEAQPLFDASALACFQAGQPRERVIAYERWEVRPGVPAFRAAIFIDQHPEERVAFQPRRLIPDEGAKGPRALTIIAAQRSWPKNSRTPFPAISISRP